MNVVYVESSAVLSWLFSEASHRAVIEELSSADQVVTSALTLIECSRALRRGVQARRMKPVDELAALRILDDAAAGWSVLAVSAPVVERARAEFPIEPIRSLDAIHVASAAVLAATIGPLRVLSLDERIRANASALGLALAP